MKTLEQLEAKLNSLRQKYKTASMTDRPLIVQRAKLIKWAIEKEETPRETAQRLFK